MKQDVVTPPNTKTPKTLGQHIQTDKVRVNPRWIKAAHAALQRLAQKRKTFTSADLLNELKKSKAKTHDLRSIGAVLLDGRNERVMEAEGLIRRHDSHNRGASVLWRSLIYKGKEEEPDDAVQSQPEQPPEQLKGR